MRFALWNIRESSQTSLHVQASLIASPTAVTASLKHVARAHAQKRPLTSSQGAPCMRTLVPDLNRTYVQSTKLLPPCIMFQRHCRLSHRCCCRTCVPEARCNGVCFVVTLTAPDNAVLELVLGRWQAHLAAHPDLDPAPYMTVCV